MIEYSKLSFCNVINSVEAIRLVLCRQITPSFISLAFFKPRMRIEGIGISELQTMNLKLCYFSALLFIVRVVS